MRIVANCGALLILAGCAGSHFRGSSGAAGLDPQTQMTALEARIAFLVDRERQKTNPGAKSLLADPELAQIARARSREMAAKNYLAHMGPDGTTSASLLMEVDPKWVGLLGENLAAQYYYKQSGISVNDLAQRFLTEWMMSPPHRDNLVYSKYDCAGVGAAANSYTIYVTVLFSTSMETSIGPKGLDRAKTQVGDRHR